MIDYKLRRIIHSDVFERVYHLLGYAEMTAFLEFRLCISSNRRHCASRLKVACAYVALLA